MLIQFLSALNQFVRMAAVSGHIAAITEGEASSVWFNSS